MKNTKWIWRVVAVFLTLAVLAGVGFAGFRVGVMQGANLSVEDISAMIAHKRGSDDNGQRDGSHGHDFDHGRGNSRGHGGFSFFSPLFGLLHLAVLGGLVWLGYTFVRRSGWRVVNVNANQEPAAPVEPEVEEKKDEA
ncbi:MAG: hypothetical protein RIR73_876 [Chloroflexota bacterium]